MRHMTMLFSGGNQEDPRVRAIIKGEFIRFLESRSIIGRITLPFPVAGLSLHLDADGKFTLEECSQIEHEVLRDLSADAVAEYVLTRVMSFCVTTEELVQDKVAL